ncbi:MAG TPA: CDP-alcohol phosphatidyltransferase family protein [Bradyrhizobium sp.]|nr:CDP-alcohol phosphatidyltransferase family protein [Bradyrhizobium sp.]
MTGSRESIVNIPNALSLYRLVMAPAIAGLAFADRERLFAILIVVSLLTDILDGLIARICHLQTRFGARLDSIADDATYVAALIGVFIFKRDEIGPHMPYLYLFIVMVALTTIVPLIKFGQTPSFHLYSFRIGGYLQGFFLTYLFVFGFQVHFYYVALSFGMLACAEVIAVTLIVHAPISNARGLYWILRERRGLL